MDKKISLKSTIRQSLSIPFVLSLALVPATIFAKVGEVKVKTAKPVVFKIDQAHRAKMQTINLIELVQEYKVKPNKQIEKSLSDIAEKRKNTLKKLAVKDHESFLATAVLDDLDTTDLPAQIDNLIEKKVSLEGSLYVVHLDYEDKSVNVPFIETDSGTFEVIGPKNHSIYKTVGSVDGSLEGLRFGSEEEVVAASLNFESDDQQLADQVSGVTDNALYIRLKFANHHIAVSPPSFNFTTSLASSSAAYFSETSYDKYNLDVEVLPGEFLEGLTMPFDFPSTSCAQAVNSVIYPILEEVNNVYPWIDLTDYNRFYVFSPSLFSINNTCPQGGRGFTTHVGSRNISTPDGQVYGTMSFSNGASQVGQIVHELGHNLGLEHAQGWKCLETVGSSCRQHTIDYGQCSSHDYAGYFTSMGSNSWLFNGPHREYLNWIDEERSVFADTTGIYDLSPLETDTSGSIDLIQVPKLYNPNDPTDLWRSYFIEFRQPLPGFDEGLPPVASDGVILHYQNWPGLRIDTQMLDMNPEPGLVSCTSGGIHLGHFVDGRLQFGQAFLSSTSTEEGGIEITPLTTTEEGNAQIKIKLPDSLGCNYRAPGISIETLNGQGDYNGTGEYLIRVTNRNSNKCPQATYGITNIPTSWSSTSGNFKVDSGNQTTINLTISPEDRSRIKEGLNYIPFEITNLSAPEYAISPKAYGRLEYNLVTDQPGEKFERF